MAKHDEISSTERLLDFIRKQDKSSTHFTAPKKIKHPHHPHRYLPFFNNTTIGIELGESELKLAKIIHLPDDNFQLLDFATIVYPSDINLNGTEFSVFLKHALGEFGVIKNKNALWSAISSVKVETKRIRIPKLAKKQIPNAVYWVVTKEVSFKKEEEILDFKILGDVTEDGVTKLEIMTYTAPRKDIFDLHGLFIKAGYPLMGISIVPFAVQKLLKTALDQPDSQSICNLFVGQDWSRIAIYSGGNLILSRGIKFGMHSMILCLSEAIKNRSFKSAQLAMEAYKKIYANLITRSREPEVILAHKIFSNFINGTFPILRVKKYNILSEDQILTIIQPALERLVRQVERTFEHYCQHFEIGGLTKIMISGPLTANNLLIKYLGRQLDLPVTVLDPFAFGSKVKSEKSFPDSVSKREAYMQAVGMALSSNLDTPNFIFTYTDRQKAALIQTVNRGILTLCIIVLFLLTAIYLNQIQSVNAKEAKLTTLKRELAQHSPKVNKELILQLLSQSQQKNNRLRKASQRFLPVATLEEISKITPANIRLVSYIAEKKKDVNPLTLISLDGIIFGDRDNFESLLSAFLLSLKKSPLFSQPVLINKRYEYFDNQKVLRFTANLRSVLNQPESQKSLKE